MAKKDEKNDEIESMERRGRMKKRRMEKPKTSKTSLRLTGDEAGERKGPLCSADVTVLWSWLLIKSWNRERAGEGRRSEGERVPYEGPIFLKGKRNTSNRQEKRATDVNHNAK